MAENPIIVIDTDDDDVAFIKMAMEQLKIERPIHFMNSGAELAAYLHSNAPPPFLVLCDVNLPGEDGFELRKRLTEKSDINYKSVPFIFWSNSASEHQIQYAYDLPAQGFFIKPSTFEELCSEFGIIINYWEKSRHPKQVS